MPMTAGPDGECPRRGIPNSLREDSHPKGRDVFRLGAQPIAVPALAGRAQSIVQYTLEKFAEHPAQASCLHLKQQFVIKSNYPKGQDRYPACGI
jgi:hypothetical protein